MSIFSRLVESTIPNEDILEEAIRKEIIPDVEHIYKIAFKKDLYNIQNGNKTSVRPIKIRKENVIRSGILKSSYLKQVFEMNPVDILINHGRNYYNGITGEVSFSINENALKAIQSTGSVESFAAKLPQYASQIRNDFSPNRIKESIFHELSHYIDDTLNNRHLTRMGERMMGTSSQKRRIHIRDQGGKHTYLTDYEIEAMMHNVFQLYRYYRKDWDKMTFEQMILKSVSLRNLYNEFKRSEDPEMLEHFKRKMKNRMHRENILGRRMR